MEARLEGFAIGVGVTTVVLSLAVILALGGSSSDVRRMK
jgi:hypothetical protein